MSQSNNQLDESLSDLSLHDEAEEEVIIIPNPPQELNREQDTGIGNLTTGWPRKVATDFELL